MANLNPLLFQRQDVLGCHGRGRNTASGQLVTTARTETLSNMQVAAAPDAVVVRWFLTVASCEMQAFPCCL